MRKYANDHQNAHCPSWIACLLGRCLRFDRGNYQKLCGQRFWTLISGDANLYLDIIEPLGHRAKERNDQFWEEYPAALNRFTEAFIAEFCDENKRIVWDRIVRLNSAQDAPPRRRRNAPGR